jgi:hypothetical protein
MAQELAFVDLPYPRHDLGGEILPQAAARWRARNPSYSFNGEASFVKIDRETFVECAYSCYS